MGLSERTPHERPKMAISACTSRDVARPLIIYPLIFDYDFAIPFYKQYFHFPEDGIIEKRYSALI